jgi:hypothetical protein
LLGGDCYGLLLASGAAAVEQLPMVLHHRPAGLPLGLECLGPRLVADADMA